MASTISHGVEKVMTMASKATSDKKDADLRRDTVNVDENKEFSTTDHGTKISTHDDWLRVVRDDRLGRYSRRQTFSAALAKFLSQGLHCWKTRSLERRSTVSTMSGFLNVSSMLEEPGLSALSESLSLQRTSHMPKC
jgi:hypothetical protein